MPAKRSKPAPKVQPKQQTPPPAIEKVEEEPFPDIQAIETIRVKDVKPSGLIHCTVERQFFDGVTTERFNALGYDVIWPAGQVRDITVDLWNACVSSGARITIVKEGE